MNKSHKPQKTSTPSNGDRIPSAGNYELLYIFATFLLVMIVLFLVINHHRRVHHHFKHMAEAQVRASDEDGRMSDYKEGIAEQPPAPLVHLPVVKTLPKNLPPVISDARLKAAHKTYEEDLKFLDEECGQISTATIPTGMDRLAGCISYRNEVIVNFRKGIQWGLIK